jgi:molecular chaperone GrpE
MNKDILTSFAGYYLEKNRGIKLECEIVHEIDFLKNLETGIFQYLLKDKESFDRIEKIKEVYKSLCGIKNSIDKNSELLIKEFQNLLLLNSARNELEKIISNKINLELAELKNLQVKTSSDVDIDYKVDDLLKFVFEQNTCYYKDPQNTLVAVLAKEFISGEEFSRIYEELKIETSLDTLNEILKKIHLFISLFLKRTESKKPWELSDENEIRTAIDLTRQKLDSQTITLLNYKDKIKKLDIEITSSLFNYLDNNQDEFKTTNHILMEKARHTGILLKRIQNPEMMNSDLSEALSHWFPTGLGLSEEHISKVLFEWNLSKHDNKFSKKSQRDFFPYKISHLMLTQDDLFIQDLARRELIKGIKEDINLSINKISETTADNMFIGDLQKLMEVISNFGKQLFKMNTLLSRDSNKPSSREAVVPQIRGTELESIKNEVGELSRLIKKFKKDLDENLLKQSQREVSFKLLGVVDFFDNLLNSISEKSSSDIKSVKESLDIIYGKLMRVLSDYGISVINCIGEKFDPSFHECVDVQSLSGKEPNIIIKDIIKGYKMGDEIIRFPKVIVSA